MNTKTYWSASEDECVAGAQRAWIEDGRDGQTVRHYYYKLLSYGLIRLTSHNKSSKNAYNFVSRILNRARHQGVIPWRAVIDPGRRSFTHWHYDNIEEYAETETNSAYRLDPHRGQPRKLEVWVEKDGIAEIADGTARRYRVPVYVCKGYGSETVIKHAAERYGDGVGWTLLYVGDFDPSGLDIQRNLADSLAEHESFPEIVRVGLTQAQTRHLPAVAALDLKTNDKRYKAFVAKYGTDQKGFEVDALSAADLGRLIEGAIVSRMDMDAYKTALSVESRIRAFAESCLRDAMNGFAESVVNHGPPGITEEEKKVLPLYIQSEEAA
jgi:hypothetical protein